MPTALVAHHGGPQVHVLAREPVGQQLRRTPPPTAPRRPRGRGRATSAISAAYSRSDALAPGDVLLLGHRAQPHRLSHGRGRPSARRARAARRRGGRCGPSARCATRVAAYAPAPAPISMSYVSSSSRRTAAESTPSGTLTVVSSGSRLPSAAKSSRPIVLEPGLQRVAGGLVARPDGVEALVEDPGQPGVEAGDHRGRGGVVVGPLAALDAGLADVAAEHAEVEVPRARLLDAALEGAVVDRERARGRARRRGTSGCRRSRCRRPSRRRAARCRRSR